MVKLLQPRLVSRSRFSNLLSLKLGVGYQFSELKTF